MKARRGPLAGDGAADNLRARRYVAKYTICPAIAHGIDARGRLGRGRASSPTSCCGTRRSSASGRTLVLKGGMIAWAQMGDANASIPTPQPVLPRPMFGAAPAVAPTPSVAFVAPAALDDGLADRLGCDGALVPVGDTRAVDQGGHGRERRAAPTSRSTPTRSRSGSTASSSSRAGDASCRWRSATSSSDDGPCCTGCSCYSPTAGSRPAVHAHPAGSSRRVAAGASRATLPRSTASSPAGWRPPVLVDAAARAGRARPTPPRKDVLERSARRLTPTPARRARPSRRPGASWSRLGARLAGGVAPCTAPTRPAPRPLALGVAAGAAAGIPTTAHGAASRSTTTRPRSPRAAGLKLSRSTRPHVAPRGCSTLAPRHRAVVAAAPHRPRPRPPTRAEPPRRSERH